MNYLTTETAAEHLTTETGVKVSPASIWRWAVQGIGGVRLQHGRLGNRILTTAEWLEQFMAEVARAKRDGKAEPVEQLQRKPRPAKTI